MRFDQSINRVPSRLSSKVADGEVEYKNIIIEGPTGVVRTSTLGVPNVGSPEGVTAVGCAKDKGDDRILTNKYSNDNMSPEVQLTVAFYRTAVRSQCLSLPNKLQGNVCCLLFRGSRVVAPEQWCPTTGR